MKRPAALFPISLALGAMMLAPGAGAREPTQLKKCQTISQPGSYELADNLVATGDCLVITADFVTIDLAGFTITGNFNNIAPGTAILAAPSSGHLQGIAARNGSISSFHVGVDLSSADGSIVEGLRVSGSFGFAHSGVGIRASGIVKGNIVTFVNGTGIVATGVVTGNYVAENSIGIEVGQGSTVIGNTVLHNLNTGIIVNCPSNVTDNTAVNNGSNLALDGTGCNNTNNVAP